MNHPSLTKIAACLLALLLTAALLFSACTPGGEDGPFSPSETTADPSAVKEKYDPIFSAPGGFYTGNVKLALKVPKEAPSGTCIRYTTDGSIPDGSSKKYGSAISLLNDQGGITVRAACFDKKGRLQGNVITNTYVRDQQSKALWTVMISASEEDLNAMYADVRAKVERPSHVEIYLPGGELVISQDAGLRLFGGSSRGLPQKSFKLIARKDHYFGSVPYNGKGTFSYPFFPERKVISGDDAGKTLEKYDSLILRNGGNDSLLATAADPKNATLLRDGICNNFAEQLTDNLNCSLSQFAAVYLNGQYYGVLDMRENLNEDYVKRVYGVNDDDVVIIKSELDTTRHCELHPDGSSCRFDNVWFFYETDETETAQKAMEEWIALCKKACAAVTAGESEFQQVFRELSDKIDLDSLAEYYAMNLYLCNTDWPHNNIKLWKYTGAPQEGNPITDGRYRFMTRDMDMAMGRYNCPDNLPELCNVASVDTFWRCLGNYVSGYQSYYRNEGTTALYPDSLYLQGLLACCLRDAGFRESFRSFCVRLAGDESAAALQKTYDNAYSQLKGDMQNYLTRWTGAGIQVNLGGWKNACKEIPTFISDRPAEFLRQLDLLMSFYD